MKMLGYSNILTVNPNDVQSLVERIFFWRIWKICLLDIFDYIQWELSIEHIDGLNWHLIKKYTKVIYMKGSNSTALLLQWRLQCWVQVIMEKEMTNLGKSGCVVISPEHPGRAERFMSNKTSGPVKVKCESVLGCFQWLSSSSFSTYLPSREVLHISCHASAIMLEMFHIYTSHVAAPGPPVVPEHLRCGWRNERLNFFILFKF